MAANWRELLTALARETALAVATWVGVLTALFGAFHLGLGGMQSRSRRRGGTAQTSFEYVPVDPGPIGAQWVDWIVAYSTVRFGTSVQQGEPVAETVLAGLGVSAHVAGAALLAVCLLGGPLAVLVGRLDSNRAASAVATTAYWFGTLWPVFTGIALLGWATETGGATRLRDPLATAPVSNYGLLFWIGVAVATPIVADLVRRVHRQRVPEGQSGGLAAAFGPSPGGVGTLEAWHYVTYLAGALVVVEYVFGVRGVGWYLFEGLVNRDLPLAIGAAVVLAVPLVALGFVRDLAGAVAAWYRDGRSGETAPSGADPGTVLAAARRRRRTVAGLVVLGVAAAVGLVGSVALSATGGPLRARTPPLDVGLVAHTLWSVTSVVLLASLVAALLGAPAGLLVGWLRSVDRPIAGVVAAVLRLPATVAVAIPLVPAAALAVLALGAPGRIEAPVTLGVLFGLVLAGYATRAVAAAARDRFREEHARREAAAASLLTGVSRIDGPAALTTIAAGEIAFLGLVPHGTLAPLFAELGRSFTDVGLVVSETFPVVLATVSYVGAVAAVPVVGVALLGDGLGAAASEVRAGSTRTADASDSARAAESAPTTTTEPN